MAHQGTAVSIHGVKNFDCQRCSACRRQKSWDWCFSPSTERRAVHSTASLHNHADKRPTTEVLSSLATEVARESLGNIVCSSASNSPAHKMFSSGPSSSLSYNLGHIGAGSNAAIAAAASQAIAATQQVSGLCHCCHATGQWSLSLLPRNRSVVFVCHYCHTTGQWSLLLLPRNRSVVFVCHYCHTTGQWSLWLLPYNRSVFSVIAATQQVSGLCLSLLPHNRSVVSVIAAIQKVNGLSHCCHTTGQWFVIDSIQQVSGLSHCLLSLLQSLPLVPLLPDNGSVVCVITATL